MKATEKQRKLAQWIQSELGVELPNDDFLGSYSKYISDNIDNFNRQISRRREWHENRSEPLKRERRTTFENTFGGAYDSDIVDCYDFGICPWGES